MYSIITISDSDNATEKQNFDLLSQVGFMVPSSQIAEFVLLYLNMHEWNIFFLFTLLRPVNMRGRIYSLAATVTWFQVTNNP